MGSLWLFSGALNRHCACPRRPLPPENRSEPAAVLPMTASARPPGPLKL